MRLPASVRHLAGSVLGRASLRVRGGPNRGLRWSISSSGRGYIRGSFEVERIGRLLRLAPPGALVWDVGAHKGYVALALARAVGADGHVVAVEPAPDNLRLLRRHLQWNHIRNTRVIEAAVGAVEGTAFFGGDGSSIAYHIGGGDLPVRLTTLPAMMPESGARAPDLLKLDVEGEEARALAAAGAALGDHTAVCVAVHSPALYQECAEVLRGRGLRVLRSKAIETWRQGAAWQGDPDLVGLGPAHPRRHGQVHDLGLQDDVS
ncbi:MAG: FkbM family methyltransferase [Longimicrobiales bacterium]